MMDFKKAFFRLYELAELGLPAERTLQNRLHQGVVVLGEGVPPLQTLKVGGSRVVARMELMRWLQATGGMGMESEARGDPTPDQPSGETTERPRRGRPRKHVAAGGAK
jgi:hypothetical protein